MPLQKKPAPKKAAAPKKPAAPKVPAPKPAKVLSVINTIPTQIFDIYVFGEGSAGELGLGAKAIDGKKPMDVTRPRKNVLLSAKDVGVVMIAVGGMHCAALTRDNKILTWGVNDQGALGRDTPKGGKMKEVNIKDGAASDSEDDSDDDGEGLNPSEAEPRAIDSEHFPEGTKFAALYAADSATFALTDTGLVYGWGTFRVSFITSIPFQSLTFCRVMMVSWVSAKVSFNRTLPFLLKSSRTLLRWLLVLTTSSLLTTRARSSHGAQVNKTSLLVVLLLVLLMVLWFPVNSVSNATRLFTLDVEITTVSLLISRVRSIRGA
jgi:hypothetical protein